MTPTFIPFMGDYKIMKENFQDKGKFIGHYIRNLTMVDEPKPMHLLQMAGEDMLLINDPKLAETVKDLVPK